MGRYILAITMIFIATVTTACGQIARNIVDSVHTDIAMHFDGKPILQHNGTVAKKAFHDGEPYYLAEVKLKESERTFREKFDQMLDDRYSNFSVEFENDWYYPMSGVLGANLEWEFEDEEYLLTMRYDKEHGILQLITWKL